MDGPDTDFGCVCTVTLTLEIWSQVKVMTHPWVMDKNGVKYYPDPTWQLGVIAGTQILDTSALWPWPWRYDLGWRSWHTLGSWTTIVWNIIQIQHGSKELWPGHTFFDMCALWPWPWRYDIDTGSRSDTPLGHGQQLCEILPTSNMVVKSYGLDMYLLVCVHCDLDLGGMIFVEDHVITLGSGTTIVWNIIQIQHGRDELWLRHGFWYVCTLTLTLEVWPKIKVMTHPSVMDHNCVKYYLDPKWQWEVMARTRIFGKCALRPWPWIYDLGSRSWYNRGSWTTIVWNIRIGQGGKKLWPGHDVDRRMDRQTGWFPSKCIYPPPPKLCLWRV